MKHNMGTADRALRAFVAAPLLAVLGLAVLEAGSVLSVVALVLAAVMVATSAVGFCPLYSLLGISTCPRRTHGRRSRVVTQG